MKLPILFSSLFLATAAWAQSPITLQKSQPAVETTPSRLVLADEAGLTVYTFKPDLPHESTCYDACAKAWPPVLVSAEKSSALTGSLGTTKRKDGALQLTVDGRPVYLFAGDQKPGDINGEGLGGVWFVLELKITP